MSAQSTPVSTQSTPLQITSLEGLSAMRQLESLLITPNKFSLHPRARIGAVLGCSSRALRTVDRTPLTAQVR